MARLPRLDLPGVPQHIVQRGIDRAPCFFEDGHRRIYLSLVREAAAVTEVSVHAYVLMTNHIHLLVTPRHGGGASAFMHRVGCQYVPWLNKLRDRTGTLFQGRFKSSLVQSERYLLCCYRYIELNPVRAGMVANPGEYRWSSYRCNALGETDALLTAHPLFEDLGETPALRQAHYRGLVAEGMTEEEQAAIRTHLNQERALGGDDFQAEVASRTGRPAAPRPRGRPRKK